MHSPHMHAGAFRRFHRREQILEHGAMCWLDAEQLRRVEEDDPGCPCRCCRHHPCPRPRRTDRRCPHDASPAPAVRGASTWPPPAAPRLRAAIPDMPRARLELDCRGVRLIGGIVHSRMSSSGVSSRSGSCGSYMRRCRGTASHSPSACSLPARRNPRLPRIRHPPRPIRPSSEQRAVEVEDRRPSTVDSGCIHHIRHVPPPLFNLGFVQ